MDPATLLPPELAPMGPHWDGVEASSGSQGEAYTGVTPSHRPMPTQGLLLPRNRAHSSCGNTPSSTTTSAHEPHRDAVQASFDMDPAVGRTESAVFSAAANYGCSNASVSQLTEVMRAMSLLFEQLNIFGTVTSGLSPAASSSPSTSAIPEFHAFEDDAILWIDNLNCFGARYGWSDQRKLQVALSHLGERAVAWHRYQGIRQKTWQEWCAKFIAAFGPFPHVHVNGPLNMDEALETRHEDSTGVPSSPSTESAAELLRVISALVGTPHSMASGSSGSSPAPLLSPAAWKIPEFRGFQDDADRWIEAVNVLGARYAWPDHYKLLVAINNIADAAAAWHRYEGVGQHSWQEWSARLIAVFGRIHHHNPVTSESDRCTTEGKAQKEHHLEAAASNCSSSAESITSCPDILIGPKICLSTQISTQEAAFHPRRPDYANTGYPGQLTCKSPDDDKQSIMTPIASPERRVDRNQALLLDRGCSTDLSKLDATKQVYQENAQPCLRPSRQSLAECARVPHLPCEVLPQGDKVSTQDEATFKDPPQQLQSIDGWKEELKPHDLDTAASHSSLSRPIECCFALTLAATTLSKCKLPRPATRELVHLSQAPTKRPHVTESMRHLKVNAREHAPLSTSDLRRRSITRKKLPLHRIQYRLPETCPAACRVKSQRGRDHRQPWQSKCCSLDVSLVVLQVKSQHDQHLQRPTRHSQCRPPEDFGTVLQGRPRRGRHRPQRHSQCRPPEKHLTSA